jgi:cyclic pyranopterin phosphate synthase
MTKLTHLDKKGKSRMVDVSAKGETLREAVARGKVLMKPETVGAVEEASLSKGDVLAVAKIAGILAAKKTGDLIPLCHPLKLTGIEIVFSTDRTKGEIAIEAKVKTVGKTGVEMEALTAVSAAALTIYDMCKAADRAMILSDIKLIRKSGGRSGTFIRKENDKAVKKKRPVTPRG